VDRILRETDTGLSAPPNDIPAITAMLKRAYEAWREGKPVSDANSASVRRYGRPKLVKEYSALMRGALQYRIQDAVTQTSTKSESA
jgi:hypothetical protein